MKPWIRKTVLSSLISLWLFNLPVHALSIYTEESPPGSFITPDGKLSGISVEIVRMIQKELGDISPIQLVLWKDGYYKLETQPDTMLFSTTRTPEREKLFHWVGPLFEVQWLLIAQKSAGLKINSLEDAKKLTKIGTYHDDAREKFLIRSGFKNLYSVKKAKQLPMLLHRGRIDAFVSTNLGVSNIWSKFYFAKNPSDIFETIFTFKTYSLYMAFSKTTNPKIINNWQRAFDKLLKQGEIKQIRDKWFNKTTRPD
ncbi:substrate-binding periplasmic protein [Dongshaea marina]|uniref:substrate-binding periplasmic protein n=1 Tax=Dongshaea marina TaxID=2047966 RepID=UPI000D3E110B|nr:ABC transporter substrate-binding protein [Dongshaea marina]